MSGPTIDGSTGLVREAVQRCSPHQDARPPGEAPALIVLHGISLPAGRFGGDAVDALFTGTLDPRSDPSFASLGSLRVSAHLFVRRDGRLVQYVPLTRRAWHAGRSRWGERTACNDFSIGIELEGADDVPYATEQYELLARLLPAMFRTWPVLGPGRVVGHCDIAPDRKTDPGPAFDWSALHARLAAACARRATAPSRGTAADEREDT